jgi:hypothetical protein
VALASDKWTQKCPFTKSCMVTAAREFKPEDMVLKRKNIMLITELLSKD